MNISSQVEPENQLDSNWNIPLFGLIYFLLLAVGFYFVKDLPHRCDEGFHGPQISLLLAGDFSNTGHITTFLGYHAVIAAVMKLLGMDSLAAARLVSLTIASTIPFLAYLVASKIQRTTALLKTVLVVSLPMIFSLMFFLYTDVWSLGALLAMIWLSLGGKHKLAATCAVIAVLIRQTNLIWVVYAACLALFHSGLDIKLTLKKLCARAYQIVWPYSIVIAAFILFFILNRGIATGDQINHSRVLNLTNIPFLLITLGLLFWPTAIAEIFRNRPERKEIRVWIIFWLVLIGFSWCFRHSSHGFNHPNMNFYYHNSLLYLWADNSIGRLIAAIGLLSAVVLLLRSRISMNPFGLFWCIGIVSVALMPVVEFRYQIPFIALFIILRDWSSLNCSIISKLNIVWLSGLSLLLLWNIINDTAFL